MEITSRTENGVTVVAVTGSVDALTSEKMLAAFMAELKKGMTLLVADLSGVDYTSSAGLRCLLTVQKEIRQKGGDFRLAGVQPNVFKVLKLSGFTNIIKMHDTAEDAVASLSGN
jgi:anti-sigma B factor antagonist